MSEHLFRLRLVYSLKEKTKQTREFAHFNLEFLLTHLHPPDRVLQREWQPNQGAESRINSYSGLMSRKH